MYSILINAYACSPGMGSEPGMAWNWCVNLANYCELHIITEGEFRDRIEATLPSLPQGANMHFYYNPVSEKIRKMCWNQGDWRFYKYYRRWQRKTLEIAKSIIAEHHIDIIHQLNMIGFREPGYLWEIENIPFVWGPIDAKDKFPIAYLCMANFKVKFFIRLKNFLKSIQLKYSKIIHQVVNRASIIISASSNSQQSIKKYYGKDSLLLNETGCYIQETQLCKNKTKETFDILWVGKMDFRKQLGIAIQSVAKVCIPNIRLHIIGGERSDQHQYQLIAKKLSVENQCRWYGKVSHEEVQKFMQQCDLFFFTSVAEGTPHVVLESIGNNLPVLCFNTCGQGDSVNRQVGVKIPLTTPKQSVEDFAQKIEYLYHHKDVLHQLSENCKQRQKELSWENKAKQMYNLYIKAIEKKSV